MLLFKFHGDLRHPTRLVATEADYDSFLAKYPLLATYLSNLLISKTAVFIGYSLEDPDFRQVLQVVASRLGASTRKRYAISLNARPTDIKRFERRGVEVINIPSPRDRYGDTLSNVFGELRDYWLENVFSVSKVTEEHPLRELLLPRTSETRLCFCAVPLDLLPLYRDQIFPIIEDAGFVPIAAPDVISPGDNVSAKIEGLIDRSAVMIAELGTNWTATELQMAISKQRGRWDEFGNRRLEIVIVATDEETIPAWASSTKVLIRPNRTSQLSEPFVTNLSQILQNISLESGVSRRNEPSRLLAAKEYRAAVIAAMTLLESKLREMLKKPDTIIEGRRLSMRNLVERALDSQLISEMDRSHILDWIGTRNAAVHTNQPISRTLAKSIVDGANRIISSFH